MIAPTLNQIEELIGHLSYQEQLWLLERLAQRLRRASGDRLLREAEAEQEQTVRAWDEATAAMGISGEPKRRRSERNE